MSISSQLRKSLLFCSLLLLISVCHYYVYVDRDFLLEKNKNSSKSYDELIEAMQAKKVKRKGEIISIQKATKEELMLLPRIGPKMADRIIQYRRKDAFKRLSDLKKVKGIGDKTFKKLEKLIKL